MEFSAENLLNLACRELPVVKRAIDESGDIPLENYLRRLFTGKKSTFQPVDDLLKVIFEYTAPLLGESVANLVCRDIEECPLVLTANHLGVDYFSHSVQGSLLFSLYSRAAGLKTRTVPVFACGNIPLDNATYPQGVLFYMVNESDIGTLPKKMPIFPNRLRRSLVSVSRGFDESMIDRATKRSLQMAAGNQVDPQLIGPLKTILQEDYGDPEVLALNTYSDQSVKVNHQIWRRLFQNPENAPHLVSLELEKIVGMLLDYDLENPQSLIWQIMFDVGIRENVLKQLNGERACWDLDELRNRLEIDKDVNKYGPANGCGTIFFWGVNPAGRRVPLHLGTVAGDLDQLVGCDEKNNILTVPFTPMGIIEGLKSGKLLPSLFTCFTVLSFARGLECVGGYFQSEYLGTMQRAIFSALKKSRISHDAAQKIAGVRSDLYLSGMLSVMTSMGNNGRIAPAGPLEIIAGGGLSMEDIDKMMALSVRDAHLAGLIEIIPDAVMPNTLDSNWKHRLALDCSCLLSEKVIIK